MKIGSQSEWRRPHLAVWLNVFFLMWSLGDGWMPAGRPRVRPDTVGEQIYFTIVWGLAMIFVLLCTFLFGFGIGFAGSLSSFLFGIGLYAVTISIYYYGLARGRLPVTWHEALFEAPL